MKNIDFLNSKNFIFKFYSAAFLSLPLLAASSSIYPVNAEVESFLAPEMIAAVGEQKTNSLNTGTRASLAIGSQGSFGSTASVSSTDAYVVDSKSVFVPLNGNWKSTFGGATASNPEGGIKANVENIRSNGPGNVFNNLASTEQTSVASAGSGSNSSSFTPADSSSGYSIDAEQANTAEGLATLEGVSSQIEVDLKSADETNPESKGTFTSTSIVYLDGNADENPVASANGSANLGLNNSLNVDLSNTEFKNAFSQAF